MLIRNVLVLGGSGFLGRHVVRQLATRGFAVRVPTRNRERAKELILLPTADVVQADVHDDATLNRLVQAADAVINLVGILHGDFERVHVVLPRRIVAACKQAGGRRLLHVSALKAAIQQGKARRRDGKTPAEFDGALLSQGKKVAYLIAGGIPNLLVDERVELSAAL